MKNLLALSALVIAGGYAAAELASVAGLTLPAALNAQNALIAFVVTLGALLLHADYARRTPIALPRLTASRPRRQGYAIRRGTEAARLATPPALIVAFTKAPACCENAV